MVGMTRVVYATVTVKMCFQFLLRKVDSELSLQVSFGSEFQWLGAATLNARLAVSVYVSA